MDPRAHSSRSRGAALLLTLVGALGPVAARAEAPAGAAQPAPPRHRPIPRPRTDPVLLEKGRHLRRVGGMVLAIGVVGGIAGAVLAARGFAQAVDGETSPAGAVGLVAVPLGAMAILVGSVMIYQGGQKIDAAERGARLSGVGPLLMEGEVRGAQVAFTF